MNASAPTTSIRRSFSSYVMCLSFQTAWVRRYREQIV